MAGTATINDPTTFLLTLSDCKTHTLVVLRCLLGFSRTFIVIAPLLQPQTTISSEMPRLPAKETNFLLLSLCYRFQCAFTCTKRRTYISLRSALPLVEQLLLHDLHRQDFVLPAFYLSHQNVEGPKRLRRIIAIFNNGSSSCPAHCRRSKSSSSSKRCFSMFSPSALPSLKFRLQIRFKSDTRDVILAFS